MFIKYIKSQNKSIEEIEEIEVHLYGSLAKTGKGHGTDIAILMGLSGYNFTTINTDSKSIGI